MSHISDQLTRLGLTKELIRLALEDRGVRVQEGTPFHRYAELIGLIGTEGIDLRLMARRPTTGKAEASVNWSGFYPSAAASAAIE